MAINWDKVIENASAMDNKPMAAAVQTPGINWNKVQQNAQAMDAPKTAPLPSTDAIRAYTGQLISNQYMDNTRKILSDPIQRLKLEGALGNQTYTDQQIGEYFPKVRAR